MISEVKPAPQWVVEWANVRSGKTRSGSLVKGDAPAYITGRKGGLAAQGLATLRAAVASIDDIQAVLESLPNPDLEWEAFNRILMAVWAACEGDPEGKELVRCWSRKSKKHTDEEIEERWQHYSRSPPTRIGYGSLVREVRLVDPNWCPPSRLPVAVVPKDEPPEDESDIFAESGIDGLEASETEGLNGHTSVAHVLGPQFAESKPENPLIALNKKHAVIGDIGGKCLVLSYVPSKVDDSIKVPSFQTFKSFSERYANQYIAVKVEKKGEEIEEPKQIGPYWLKWTKRRSYEGIDLVPGGPEVLPGGYLNLWKGFAVDPVAGGWPLMKRHIREVLAAGDDAAALYIVRWAAWAVQNPGERAEVALVFRGGKGSGKGTFANALRKLFGQHGLQIFNSKHMVGSFNSHLRNCILLFADESFWAGDKQGESVLKGMLTEPTLMIEQKGIDATPWRNRLHVVMAANAEWVIPASHDERRYAMFDVSDSRMDDSAYFRALHNEMRNGGLAAMMHDLLCVDLADWHPRMIVRNEALRLQKERGMDPRWAWLEWLLQQGWLPQAVATSRDTSSSQHLLESIKEFDPKIHINPTALGRFLRERGCVKLHTVQGNQWQFLALSTMRRQFDKKWGSWPWDENLDEWRTKAEVNSANVQR